MELEEKIDSISEANFIAEISTMLDQSMVRISWWGQRLVSIDGYEGEIEINKLAKKYLEAVSYQRDHDTSLQSRLDCSNLWERVEKLYIDSDNQLEETSIYHTVVPLLEFRPWCRVCAGDPQAIMKSKGMGHPSAEQMFAFSPQRFKEYWSESMKVGTSYGVNPDGTDDVKWYASREMVESALTAQR